MKATMKFIYVVGLISAVSFVSKCTHVDFVSTNSPGQGGSTEVSLVAGKLMEPDGVTPATGASVVMRPHAYLAAVPLLGKRRATGAFWACTTTTDSIGAYRFTSGDSIPAGVYCIEGRDESNNRVLIDSITIAADVSSTRFLDTLKPPAAIQGQVQWNSGATEAYVRVFGLAAYAKAGEGGAFLLANLPAGELRIQRLVFRSGIQSCDTITVAAVAGDTVVIGNVVFDSRGGSVVAPQTVAYGGYAAEPTPPTGKACSFAGWYKESACTTEWRFEDDKVTAPTTLYAKWLVRDVDGNVYTTVKIGNQVWLAQNLKTTRYNDSTAIPTVFSGAEWESLATPGYCWYDDDSATHKNPCGALYNWYAVNTGKLAPAGWRVSTEADWDALLDSLLAQGYSWDGTTDKTIAKALAAGSYWSHSTTNAAVGNDLSKNNGSGFTAYPGGYRSCWPGAGFIGLGDEGNWWTTGGLNEYEAVYMGMGKDDNIINRIRYPKKAGFSVRCIRDN